MDQALGEALQSTLTARFSRKIFAGLNAFTSYRCRGRSTMLGGVEGFTKADLKSILAGFDPGIKHLIEAGYIMASKSRNPRIRKVACVVEPIYLDRVLENMFLQRNSPSALI